MYGSSDQGFYLVVFIHRILWSPTSKESPPTCCLISCEAKGVVYHWNTESSSGTLLPWLHSL